MKTKKKAISLIVLVITIIVLAILAATVIVTITNSGIINRATDTVKEHDLTEVRSMANLAWAEALMDNNVTTDAEYEAYVKQYLTNAGVDITEYEITASASGMSVGEKQGEYMGLTITPETEGVTFTKADGVTPGDPNNLEEGDIVIYGDYEYRYNVEPEYMMSDRGTMWMPIYSGYYGWSVILRNECMEATSVGEMCGNIYGAQVVNMTATFCGWNVVGSNPVAYGAHITEAPKIPSSVRCMYGTFESCTSLTKAPVIPSSVTVMDSTFSGCTSLTEAPVIPSSVTDMYSTFSGCTSLTEAPVIPSSVTDMNSTFSGCTSLTGTIKINSSTIGIDAAEDEVVFYRTFADITNQLVIQVPENSLTYTNLVAAYGETSNITIEPFTVEE